MSRPGTFPTWCSPARRWQMRIQAVSRSTMAVRIPWQVWRSLPLTILWTGWRNIRCLYKAGLKSFIKEKNFRLEKEYPHRKISVRRRNLHAVKRLPIGHLSWNILGSPFCIKAPQAAGRMRRISVAAAYAVCGRNKDGK